MNNGKTSVFDGSNETVVYSGSMNTTSLSYKAAVIGPTGGSWTRSELNGLAARVGYSSDTSPMPYWNALMVEVDAR